MHFSQRTLRALLCLAAFAGVLSAQSQSFAILPGPQSTSTTIPVYSADPFALQTTITGLPQGAFQILPKQDGTKYYVISNTAGSGITVVNNNFQLPRQIASTITAAPTLAAMSPDSRRLVIIAGSSVYLIDTAFDTVVGSAMNVSGTPVDIAFSQDSLRAFILSTNGQNAVVTPIDLSINSMGTALTLTTSGSATSLSTGPNGLLYLTALNAVIEINPRTLQRTTTDNAFISVNGSPGKLVFTNDGRYALAVSQTPNTGALAYIFDLVNRTATQVSRASQSGVTRLDKIAIAGDNRIYAWSKDNTTLYEMGLAGGLNPSGLQFALPTTAVNGFGLSNEYPAKSLILENTINGQNTFVKVDPITYEQNPSRYPVPADAGTNVQFVGLTPSSGATQMRPFNTKQTLTAGAYSLPMVVRLLDAQGRPVNNALVTYTANNSSLTFDPTSTTFTNSDGYAQAYVKMPANPGVYQVQASVATILTPATFELTIPGSGPGTPCVSNCGSSALSIYSGNGQLISEQNIAKQLMTVIAKDPSGNPVAGQVVTFAVTQGYGTLQCPGIGDTFDYIPTGTCTNNGLSIDVLTDTTGRAGVKYLATSIFGQSFAPTIITATSGTANVNFVITTVLVARANGGGQASLPVAYLYKPEPESSGFRVLRGAAGTTIAQGVQVQVVAADGPQLGQPIPNVALNVGPLNAGDPTKVPSARCVGGTPLTDAQGIATCDVVLGPVVTSSPTAIDVNVGGVIGTSLVTVVVTQGPPSNIVLVAGNNTSARPGQQVVLRGRVVDAAGSPIANVPVTWAVSQGSGTLTSAATTTDASGEAQATVTLGSNPGTVVVRMTAGTAPNQATGNFNLTVQATISAVNTISGGGQTAVVNQAFGNAVVVQVLDNNNLPVSGVPVQFTVASGSATLGTPNATTDANGRAQTTVTAGGAAGPITIRASAGGRTADFALTARLPGPTIDLNSFRNGASGAIGLTPCGIAIASGAGLATGTVGTVQANPFIGPLPTTLSNVSVDVNGIPAPIFWVSNTATGGEAVAFQTPCEVTAGAATVTVRVGGGNTVVQNVPVSKYQPGIFETVINGQKWAVLLHSDGSYVTPDNPAQRGETLTLFATGIGPVATGTGKVGTGQVSNALIAVGVNNAGVRSEQPVYMPGAVGLYTIKFDVPADTQPNTRAPLGLIVTDPSDPNAQSVYAQGSFFPII